MANTQCIAICHYSERPQNALLEIEQRAALCCTSPCSPDCPLIHFMWGILRPLRVYANTFLYLGQVIIKCDNVCTNLWQKYIFHKRSMISVTFFHTSSVFSVFVYSMLHRVITIFSIIFDTLFVILGEGAGCHTGGRKNAQNQPCGPFIWITRVPYNILSIHPVAT